MRGTLLALEPVGAGVFSESDHHYAMNGFTLVLSRFCFSASIETLLGGSSFGALGYFLVGLNVDTERLLTVFIIFIELLDP